jgi:hypothetical protein
MKGLQSGLGLTSLKRLHTSLSHFFDSSLERRLELRRVAFGLGYRLKVTPILIVQFQFDGFDLPVQLNLRHPFAPFVNSSEVILACIQAPVKCQKTSKSIEGSPDSENALSLSGSSIKTRPGGFLT